MNELDDEQFQKLMVTYNYRRVCSVPSCRRKPGLDGSIKMHHFPKDKFLASLWKEATGIDKLNVNAVICSRHFIPSDYHPGSLRLKRGIIPTQNLDAIMSDVKCLTLSDGQVFLLTSRSNPTLDERIKSLGKVPVEMVVPVHQRPDETRGVKKILGDPCKVTPVDRTKRYAKSPPAVETSTERKRENRDGTNPKRMDSFLKVAHVQVEVGTDRVVLGSHHN
ncbi:unnamed protein product [Notodromas monacha]|uniref:THAP-type domain-containing protein n=1 Tax=Notodromas monacha TaxID=399045 RepID=A0A7R9BIC0_9CRUS|nr:unnamed protein product [Notodromas monacha]CAG0916057.1 unnamed protein product [Notodromas monacha]